MKVGRSRWKLENETLSTSKQGYRHDRNFGHGSEILVSVLLVLNLLVLAL